MGMTNHSMFSSLALAAAVGSLVLLAHANAATHAPTRAIVVAPAASAASAPTAAQHRLSPYAAAARRQALAASGAEHAPVVPPSMRRTQRAVGRVPPQ